MTINEEQTVFKEDLKLLQMKTFLTVTSLHNINIWTDIWSYDSYRIHFPLIKYMNWFSFSAVPFTFGSNIRNAAGFEDEQFCKHKYHICFSNS